MKITVSNFLAYTVPLEGWLPCMYVDDRNLVTCDLGDLIDPIGAALALEWCVGSQDGEPATPDQIRAEWTATKNSGMAGHGGGHQQAGKTLFLSRRQMEALYTGKLFANEQALAQEFPGWGEFPATVQLACHSMRWAMGDFRAKFPRFCAALNATPPDFLEAGAQSRMTGDAVDPSLHRRNNANLTLLVNAYTGPLVDQDLAALSEGTLVPMQKWQPDGTWK